MSSDPTRPVPEWWQQPQDPQDSPDDAGRQGSGSGYQANAGYQGSGSGYQANAGYQGNAGWKRPDYGPGSQETRQFPVDQGSQETQVYPDQQYQGYQGGGGPRYQDNAGYQGNTGYQDNPGYQGNPGYQDNPGYQGSGSAYQAPPAPGYQAPGYQAAQPAPGYRRRRRRRWPWITLIVIVLLLVGIDRGANAYAENQMASQFQSNLGLSGKPSVNIEGFPFLTQVAAHDFHTVDITASNETINTKSAGSGLLEIASLNATLHGLHFHGFSSNSATVDQFNASALITFTALGNVGGVPQGITLSPDGPNQVKASVDIFGFTGDAVAKVTKVGTNKINVQVVDAGGLPSDVLGNLMNFTITIPKLPAGVSIQSVSVTQQGLRITATGQNTTFSQ